MREKKIRRRDIDSGKHDPRMVVTTEDGKPVDEKSWHLVRAGVLLAVCSECGQTPERDGWCGRLHWTCGCVLDQREWE